MKSIKGKIVLVTGGAKGMGRAYVEKAIQDKAKQVIIWDIDEDRMYQLYDEFKNEETAIHPFKVDVTDTNQIYRYANIVLKRIGHVDLLINNAGIVLTDYFINHSREAIDLTMQINSVAPMHIVRAFLPSMSHLKEAHIVNIASGAGYIYCPKIITYCSSKWAMLGWSQGLSVELKQIAPHIKVTTVTPGHIDTGMFDNAHSALMPKIPVEKMVDAVWRGIQKDKELVCRPNRLQLVPKVRAFLGRKGWNWVAQASGLNDFMAQ